MIRDAPDSGIQRHQLYRTLGVNFTLCPPPEDIRRAVLNEVWMVITKLENPTDYINAADVWIEYPVKYFGPREVINDLSEEKRDVAWLCDCL